MKLYLAAVATIVAVAVIGVASAQLKSSESQKYPDVIDVKVQARSGRPLRFRRHRIVAVRHAATLCRCLPRHECGWRAVRRTQATA